MCYSIRITLKNLVKHQGITVVFIAPPAGDEVSFCLETTDKDFVLSSFKIHILFILFRFQSHLVVILCVCPENNTIQQRRKYN